jgi:dTDP-4-dehydrorhamnose 3,5-epimerase
MFLDQSRVPSLPGVQLFKQAHYSDPRGSFTVLWNSNQVDHLFRGQFRQVNSAESRRGVLRGMHRQNQSKLVYPICGQVYDVALDPETGQWFGTLLDPSTAMFIPPHYAHGYFVLSDTAIVQYTVDTPYDPSAEQVFPWNGYSIEWPLTTQPLLSTKDAGASK